MPLLAKRAEKVSRQNCQEMTFFFFSFCLAVTSRPPEFDQTPPERTTVKAQELINLRCRSKPPVIIPTVYDWRKDGKPFRAEDLSSGRITTNSGQLLIKSARREDSGNYTCMLVNSEGNVTSNNSEVIVVGQFLQLLLSLLILVPSIFNLQSSMKHPPHPRWGKRMGGLLDLAKCNTKGKKKGTHSIYGKTQVVWTKMSNVSSEGLFVTPLSKFGRGQWLSHMEI